MPADLPDIAISESSASEDEGDAVQFQDLINSINADMAGNVGSSRRPEEQVPDDVAQSLLSMAEVLPPSVCVNTQIRHAKLVRKFTQAHKTCKQLVELGFEGAERSTAAFAERCCHFLHYWLLNTKKYDRHSVPPRPLVHPGTNKPIYAGTGSLFVMKTDVKKMLHYFPQPALDADALKRSKSKIDAFTSNLIEVYGLTTRERNALTMDPESTRTLIEIIYDEFRETPALAVQWHALILAFFYTGGRGGSLLRTGRYNEFITWRDVVFRPAADEHGTVIGIGVNLTLRNWKGYHKGRRLRVTYKLKPITNEKNLLLDIAAPLLLMALERELLPVASMDELLECAVTHTTIEVDEVHKGQPVFLARASRGGRLLPDQPAHLDSQTRTLVDLLKKAGLHTGSEAGDNTFYSFRRGFATLGGRALQGQHLKHAMGHRARSYTAVQTYDQSFKAVNMTEALLQEGASATEAFVSPALHRKRPPTQIDSDDVLGSTNVMYRHLKGQVAYLKECLKYDSQQWLTLQPWKQLHEAQRLKAAHLGRTIVAYQHRMRSLVGALRARQRRGQAVELSEPSDVLYGQLQERAKKLEQTDQLALNLLKQLEENETELVEQAIGRGFEQGEHALVTEEGDEVIDVDINADEIMDAAAALEEDDPLESARIRADAEALEGGALEDADDKEEEEEEAEENVNDEGDTEEPASTRETAEKSATEDRREGGEAITTAAPPASPETTGPLVPKTPVSPEEAAQPENSSSLSASRAAVDTDTATAPDSPAQALAMSTNVRWLRALAQVLKPSEALLDQMNLYVSRAPDASEERYLCALCRDDDTAGQDKKEEVWKVQEKAQKLRHDQQYHSIRNRYTRWKALQCEGEGSHAVWRCPFCDDYKLKARGATDIRKHLWNKHRDHAQLPEYVRAAVSPETRKEAMATIPAYTKGNKNDGPLRRNIVMDILTGVGPLLAHQMHLTSVAAALKVWQESKRSNPPMDNTARTWGKIERALADLDNA